MHSLSCSHVYLNEFHISLYYENSISSCIANRTGVWNFTYVPDVYFACKFFLSQILLKNQSPSSILHLSVISLVSHIIKSNMFFFQYQQFSYSLTFTTNSSHQPFPSVISHPPATLWLTSAAPWR